MRTGKIIEALEKWSPKGLCSGLYFAKQTPDKRRTEACAVGCLVAEAATSPEGRKYLAKNHNVNSVIKAFKEGYVSEYNLSPLIDQKFDLDPKQRERIINFNDSCLELTSTKIKNNKLPRDLKRTIVRLRKLYEAKHPEE